ncbi:N-acetylmuramoyl-L-alanine amidase [Candidatus Zixiibacteriota bacterium]
MKNRFNSYKIYLLAIILVTAIPAEEIMAKKADLLISGGKEKISLIEKDDITYISFSEMVDIFGGQLDWEIIGHQVKFEEDTIRFDFLIGSPYFKRNDSIFNMTYPAEYSDGQLYLPPATFIHFFDQMFYHKITWEEQNQTVRIDSDYFNVHDISFSAKANGLLIEVFMSGAMPYDVFITEGNWVNISIRGAKLNRPQILSRKNSRIMYGLKTHQQNENGQISFRLKRKIDKWHHKIQQDPPRIQISISDVNFEMSDEDSMPQIGPDNIVDVIVIDAGHGGKHSGAVGQGKTREKEVALDIAKELAKLIRKEKQFKVIMTRDRDKTVTLEERAEIANNAACDLFISIHANSSLKNHIRGWNVFFLAQAKNDSARAVAQFENSSFLKDRVIDENLSDEEIIDPINLIVSEMIMTEFQTESQDFALMCDREFRRNLNTTARGVDQAAFFVLNKVYSPSILIESGFISNRTDEKLLKNKKYQKTVAKSLYNAIKRFKTKYENQ